MVMENSKIIPLIDETGAKLPKNIATQFREVQGGLEHLKSSAETIIVKLDKVGDGINRHTTDLALITQKVKSIESAQKKHIEITISMIKSIKNLGVIVNSLRIIPKSPPKKKKE